MSYLGRAKKKSEKQNCESMHRESLVDLWVSFHSIVLLNWLDKLHMDVIVWTGLKDFKGFRGFPPDKFYWLMNKSIHAYHYLF